MFNPRRLTVIAHDLLATILAVLVAYFLRLGDAMGRYESDIVVVLAILTPLAFVTYWLFGLYRGVWRFASTPDLLNIVKAVTALALVLAALDFVTRGTVLVPRTVPPIYWLVQILALAGPRLFYRHHRDRRHHRRSIQNGYRIPVLIAGTGHEADEIIRRLETSVEPMQPVGLLTHKKQHVGDRLRGVPVLGLYGEVDVVVDGLRRRGLVPRRLIFTGETLKSESMLEPLLGAARQLGLTAVRPEAGYGGVEGGGKRDFRLAPIAIEDLLGRQTREIDLGPIRALVRGRRVAVTGGGGSIGSELCRQIAALGPERLVILDNSEHALYQIGREVEALAGGVALVQRLADIRDAEGLKHTFVEERPALVFHAAALKHVNLVEAHPVDGALTNTLGTRNVADAALEAGALAVVAISTDKAVDPVSVLGASKRATELYCAALDARCRAEGRPTRFLSVRFGNVLGSSGSVVPLFREQLRRGGPLTVTHPDMERYFMTISEAVTLVLMASAMGTSGDEDAASTFVLDMGRPVKIVDLASQMIRLAGLEPGADIEIAFTGLRPGERLKEALESPGEKLVRTSVDGIMAAPASPGLVDRLDEAMAALDRAVSARDPAGVRTALERLVPEYRPRLPAKVQAAQ